MQTITEKGEHEGKKCSSSRKDSQLRREDLLSVVQLACVCPSIQQQSHLLTNCAQSSSEEKKTKKNA